MLFRPSGPRGGLNDDRIQPGDLIATGRSLAALTTVGAGTITAAMIAAGIINRTGPTAGYTDTFDTAWNILQALAGNFPQPDTVQGLSFELTFINTVAFANTVAAPTNGGVVLGTNVNVAASLVRDYLVTINNASPPQNFYCGTTSANPTITLNQPYQMGTFDYSNNKAYGQITPGMSVYGTGIPAGATVIGLIQGQQGMVTGFTLSANATATAASVALALTPTITIQGLRSSTL